MNADKWEPDFREEFLKPISNEQLAAAWSVILGEKIDAVYEGVLIRQVDELPSAKSKT